MWYMFLRVKLAVIFHDERGDLSTYLAQGILALAALSLTGVVMVAFTGAGTKVGDTEPLTAGAVTSPPRICNATTTSTYTSGSGTKRNSA